jgi:hypothetical protein
VFVDRYSRHTICARTQAVHAACTPTMMGADLVTMPFLWQLGVGYVLRHLKPSDAIARRFRIHKALKAALRASGLPTQDVSR